MIIAYYPGSGGNRFYLWLNKRKNFILHQGYDNSVGVPLSIDANRYPGRSHNQINSNVVFTHCLNYDVVTKIWPGHTEIYFLNLDSQLSLKRHWKLFQSKNTTDQHPVSGPFSAIVWHNEYYQQYPYQLGNAIEVNEKTYPEFIDMMMNEINSVECREFDFAQTMYDSYGANAPIVDLYNEQFIK